MEFQPRNNGLQKMFLMETRKKKLNSKSKTNFNDN